MRYTTPLLLVLFICLMPLAVFAAPAADAGFAVVAPQTLDLAVGKSLVVSAPSNVGRVSIVDPEVVGMVMVDPRTAYLTGKKSGSTALNFWDKSEKLLRMYDVNVTTDAAPLKSALQRVLPESEVQVVAAKDTLTLAGMVKSPEHASRAVALAEAYAPGKVVNLMQVGGVQEVMLEVKIAEVSKSVLKRLGVNLAYINSGSLLNGEVFYTFLNGLTGFDEQGRFRLSNNVNSAFTFRNGNASWSGFIDALKENGMVKMLAEPNLICLSGKTSNFLAGGEIPIPVPQGLGTTAIEFKEFGVGLEFKPLVLDDKRISIEVRPEISELDYANAIVMSGLTIPALTTRRAYTSVELASGQSFAIAGLVKDSMRETSSKFPGLGEVPVLGALFSSKAFQKNLTELVIIVTPRLVKPMQNSDVVLPTELIVEPDDFEFYVLGLTEGRDKSRLRTTRNSGPAQVEGAVSGFDGKMGHAPGTL